MLQERIAENGFKYVSTTSISKNQAIEAIKRSKKDVRLSEKIIKTKQIYLTEQQSISFKIFEAENIEREKENIKYFEQFL